MLHKKFVGALAACATLLSALAFTSPAMASGSTVNPLNKAAITLVKRNITFYQRKIVGDKSDLAAKRSRAAATGVIDRNGNLTDLCKNTRGEFDSSTCEYFPTAESYENYAKAKNTLWKHQNALASAQQQLIELNTDFTPEVFANYSGDNPANSLSAKFLIKEINNLKNDIAADKSDLADKRIAAAEFGAIDKNGNLTDVCKNVRGEFDSSTCEYFPTAESYENYAKAKNTLQYHENALDSALQQLKELNNSATSNSTTSDNAKVQNLETEIAKDRAEVTQYRELAAAAGVIDKNGNLTDLCTNARGEFDSSTCSLKPTEAYRNYLNALQKLAKNINNLAVLRHQLGEDEDDSNESEDENEGESNDESDDESDDYSDFDDFDWDDLDDLLDEIDFDDFDWSSDDYEDTNYYDNDYSYNPYYY